MIVKTLPRPRKRENLFEVQSGGGGRIEKAIRENSGIIAEKILDVDASETGEEDA